MNTGYQPDKYPVLYDETNSQLYFQKNGIQPISVGDPVITIYKKKITLTDTQIKALPTTTIELIPAPGTGKIIFPTSGLVLMNSEAGAYTNVGFTGGGITDTYIVSDGYNYSFGHFDMTEFCSGLGGSKAQIWLNQYAAQSFVAGDYEVVAGVVSAGEPKSPKYLPKENFPMILKVENFTAGYGTDLGDFTGGNAANTIEITILYSIVDL